MMPTVSAATHLKANRLNVDGKVEHVKGLVYRVEGDHDTYTVHLGYPQELSGACSCPSKAEVCSHILAACIDWKVDRELLLEAILRQAIHPVQEVGIE